MSEFLITVGLGLLVSLLGICNMRGNLSSIHSYHRHRVTEENKKPFGRLVGVGTLTVGISSISYGVLALLSDRLYLPPLRIIGTALLLIGIVAGLATAFYAMMKYNKGIF